MKCVKCDRVDTCKIKSYGIVDLDFIIKFEYKVVGCKKNGSIILYPREVVNVE